MTNPKDWFRRRRSDMPEHLSEADPFDGDAVLDLGQDTVLLGEAALANGDGAAIAVASPRILPPPPLRPSGARREGRVIDRSAFTIRPEIQRKDRPTHRPIETRPTPPKHGGDGQENRRASVPPRLEPALSPAAAPSADSPGFTIAAPGTALRRQRAQTARPGALLREAFTPTRPKRDAQLFSGRAHQLQRIIAAIEEERAHVVVYGERGSGKTSLCNVLAAKAEEAGYFVLRFACSSGLSFEDIFRNLLRRLPVGLLADGIGAGSRAGIDNFEQLLPGPHFSIAELVAVLERIHDRHVILIVDEYDRVTSDETKSKLAEFIKIMSDASAPVTLLLIGVADDVADLFGKHPSLQRTLIAVPMPLMTRREIDGIIDAGEAKSGLRFEPELHGLIADLAQGLPYHAQLLCLFAARSAIARNAHKVERQDLRNAILSAVAEADSRIKEAYTLAIGSEPQTSFHDVLFYAARCHTDEFGAFSAADVAAAWRKDASEVSLLSLQYPLKKLTDGERGAVLRRFLGTGGLRYQFCSQMMRHYVLARQAEQRGLI